MNEKYLGLHRREIKDTYLYNHFVNKHQVDNRITIIFLQCPVPFEYVTIWTFTIFFWKKHYSS